MACYLRNGTKARRALPCNHTAIVEGRHTSCCDPDDLCLTNGLCRDPAANELTNFAWFFGCTDPTFKDPSCGTYCDKVNSEISHLMFQCPQPETWCCNTGVPAPAEDRLNRTNTTCCSISELVFKAPEPTVYTVALYSGIPFSVGTLTTAKATASSNSTALATISSVTSSGNALNTEGASDSPTPRSATPSLAIGLGTGLGAFALLALAGGFFFVWRRRKRSTETPPSELTSDGPKELTGEGIAESARGKERYEIMEANPRTEVMGDVYRAELPAGIDGEKQR